MSKLAFWPTDLDSTWRGSAPRQDDFRADTTLPPGYHQVQGTDFVGSGFDRGHMCPSADRTSTITDNSATFLMDMLEMREALAEARAKRDIDAVTKLGGTIEKRRASAMAKLADGFASNLDLAKLVPLLGELRFYRRFLDEVSAIEDEAAETSAERSSASEATDGPPPGGMSG